MIIKIDFFIKMRWIILFPILISSFYLYKYAKKKAKEYITGKVMEELDRINDKVMSETQFKPIRTQSAKILFEHNGKQHSIYVPYNRRNSSAMIGKKVYLIKNGEKIEITQKPGIPYMISAEHMNGDKIIIENIEGEIIKEFDKTEIPSFTK